MTNPMRQTRRRPALRAAIIILLATAIILGCAPAAEPSPPADATTPPPAGTTTPPPPSVVAATPSPAATPPPSLTPTPTPPADDTPSPARITNPDATPEELTALASGNNDFAFNLYRALGENADGNLFISPYSVSQALAMAYAGAAGNTAAQMSDALRFDLPPPRLHPAFNALDQELATRSRPDAPVDLPELNIANALWSQEGYPFRPQFLDLIAANYGANPQRANFTNKAGKEQAAADINRWASDQTQGKIPAIVNEGSFAPCATPDDICTAMLIANAVYFKGQWAEDYDFKESATRDDYFHRPDGSRVQAPMMRQTREFRYTESDNYQAVALPYAGHLLSMLVILPAPDRFGDFTAALDSAAASEIIADLHRRPVILTMPRFRLEKSTGIRALLENMGMTDAFSHTDANFSGMGDFACPPAPGEDCVYISDIFQRAFVEVNEQGTEAAAVTAAGMGYTTSSIPPTPPPPVVMTVDRPFLFLIRDDATNTILFLGHITDPTIEN